jgi:hypothetical protein
MKLQKLLATVRQSIETAVHNRRRVTHEPPPEDPKEKDVLGGKKSSGGSGMHKRRNAKSLAGYLGYRRGLNKVEGKRAFLYASWREADRIAALLRDRHRRNRQAMTAAQA